MPSSRRARGARRIPGPIPDGGARPPPPSLPPRRAPLEARAWTRPLASGILFRMQAGDVVARRFEVERFAGAGAMGLVYRAADRTTGAWIALKVLSHGSAGRFLREARVLAEVAHPHIVRYVDHGYTDAGEPYLAMEWLEGVDLSQRLLSGPLAMAEAIGLTRSVAGAP